MPFYFSNLILQLAAYKNHYLVPFIICYNYINTSLLSV